MNRLYKLFTVSFMVQLFSSCGQTAKPVNDVINCNVAGYSFSLGENIEAWKKDWPLEEFDLFYRDSLQLFSDTYEEHSFSFYFYSSRLILVQFMIPRSELDGHPVEIAGEVVPLDKDCMTKTVLKNPNWIIEFTPFDFEGMQDISIMIAFAGAEIILEENAL